MANIFLMLSATQVYKTYIETDIIIIIATYILRIFNRQRNAWIEFIFLVFPGQKYDAMVWAARRRTQRNERRRGRI